MSLLLPLPALITAARRPPPAHVLRRAIKEQLRNQQGQWFCDLGEDETDISRLRGVSAASD